MIPEIDAKYRTIPKARSRVLVGASATGNQTLLLALRNPHYFKRALVQSLPYQNANNSLPLYDEFIQGLINDQTPPEETPPLKYTHQYIHGDCALLEYLGSFYPHAKHVKLYMDWGSYENPSYDLFGIQADTLLNNDIVKCLDKKAKHLDYDEPHEGHGWGQWATQLSGGLPILLKGKEGKKCNPECPTCK